MALPQIINPDRTGLFVRLIANGLAQAAMAILSGLMIDKLLDQRSAQENEGHQPVLLFLLMAAASIYVILRAWQRRDAEAFGLAYVHELRLAIFRKICSMPMSGNSPRLGPLVTRLTNDLLAVKNWVSYGIAGIVVGSTTVITALIYLGMIAPALAVTSIVAISITVGMSVITVIPLHDIVREVRNQRGRLARILGDRLLERHTIQSLGRVDAEVRKVARESQHLSDLLIRRGLWSGILRFTSDATFPIAVCLVTLAASATYAPSMISEEASSALSGSSLLAWVFIMGIVVAQLQDIARGLDYRINYTRAIARVNSLMAFSVIPEASSARTIDMSDRELVLTLRSEAEAEHPPVEVSRGQLMMLKHGSRLQRSQLLRRIARLSLEEAEGVTIGGVPASKVSLGNYRELVVLVSPDIPLLRGTIGGNLRKATKAGTNDQLIHSIYRVCGLVSNDASIEDILATPIGEAGTKCDPALMAMVRLACALLRGPAFVLIDDALVMQPQLRRLEAYADFAALGVLVSAPDEQPPELDLLQPAG